MEIDDELEERFRKVAVAKFGPKKGYLKKATEEALHQWIRKEEEV